MSGLVSVCHIFAACDRELKGCGEAPIILSMDDVRQKGITHPRMMNDLYVRFDNIQAAQDRTKQFKDLSIISARSFAKRKNLIMGKYIRPGEFDLLPEAQNYVRCSLIRDIHENIHIGYPDLSVEPVLSALRRWIRETHTHIMQGPEQSYYFWSMISLVRERMERRLELAHMAPPAQEGWPGVEKNFRILEQEFPGIREEIYLPSAAAPCFRNLKDSLPIPAAR
jgi:hypothetical protein